MTRWDPRAVADRSGGPPTVDDAESRNEALHAFVRRVRLHWWAYGAAWATVASVAVVALAYLLGFAVEALGIPVPGEAMERAAAALTLIASGTAAWSGYAVVRWSDTVEFARWMDRRGRLEERLSTGLEIGAAPGPVGMALQREIVALLPRLAVGRFVPIRPAVLLATGVVAISVAASMHVALEVRRGASPRPDAVSASSEDRRETRDPGDDLPDVASVRDVASLVREDAVERSDPTLQAVARELADIGSAMDLGAIGDAEARRRLDRAVERLEAEYGDRADVLTDMLAGAGDRAIEAATSDAPASDEAPADAATSRTSDDVDRAGAPFDAGAERDVGESSDGVNEGASPAGTPAGVQTVEDGNVYYEISPEQLARLEEERAAAQRLRTDAPLGGAQGGGGDGDSAQPGFGGHELFSDAELGSLAWSPASTDPVSLDAVNVGQRRIRLDTTPEEDLTDVVGTQVVLGSWERRVEAPISAEVLGLADRATVGRYFGSTSTQESEGP